MLFFSISVFSPFPAQFPKVLFLRVILLFPKQALVFTRLVYKSFENTVEKGEIARNEQFSFLSVFYPFEDLTAIFYKKCNCRLQTL